jgi:GTPase SAR1 family protein
MSNLRYKFKLCLVGNSKAGKTHYVNKLTNRPEDTEPTIGVDFKCHLIVSNGYDYRFQIYDTSGLRCFYEITKSYFDITNIFVIFVDPFNFKPNDLLFWIREINDYKIKMEVNLGDLKILIIINNHYGDDIIKSFNKTYHGVLHKNNYEVIYLDKNNINAPLKYIIDYYEKKISKYGHQDTTSVTKINKFANTTKSINTPLLEQGDGITTTGCSKCCVIL